MVITDDVITELVNVEINKHRGDLVNPGLSFSFGLTEEQAIAVIMAMHNKDFPHPEIFDDVMCKEYGDDDDWVGVTYEDLNGTNRFDDVYETFEIHHHTCNINNDAIDMICAVICKICNICHADSIAVVSEVTNARSYSDITLQCSI